MEIAMSLRGSVDSNQVEVPELCSIFNGLIQELGTHLWIQTPLAICLQGRQEEWDGLSEFLSCFRNHKETDR